MDDNSGNKLLSFMSGLFRSKNETPYEDIEEAIMEASEEGDLKDHEEAMLLGILGLGETQVLEVFIPRTDIVCIEATHALTEAVEVFVESGHSRIPVFEENRDNIIGVLHAKDLLHHAFAPDAEHPSLREIMREPYFIPETKNLRDLLQEFRTRKIHLAIALDEYGGTSGLITLEDVLEEVVGEIEDEHDAPRPEDIQVMENGEILVSGRTPLEDLAESTEIRLESEQVETVGGYLCEVAGRVPAEGEEFEIQGNLFQVREADAKQLFQVLIKPVQ